MKDIGNKYKNGQPITKVEGELLTYFFENGEIKAQGKYINEKMEGKWIFNKKEGYLWQVGNLKNNKKHGPWIRSNPDGTIQKEQVFENGKIKA